MSAQLNISSKSGDSPSKMNMENVKSVRATSNIIYSKVSTFGKEKYIGLQIKNLNDLKKSIPRVKLPSILSPNIQKNLAMPEKIKEKLQKYCRACAGMKVPMVDIFSEKGNQMRLYQQIQHLEDIDKDSSLSTQMCMECICDLRASYKLFMQIKKAEMKLKSIFDSLSKTTSQQSPTNVDNETNFLIEKMSESPHKTGEIVICKNDNDQSHDKVKSVTEVQEQYNEFHDTFNDEDMFEDFEPIDNYEISESFEKETIDNLSSDNSAYQYDKLIDAYIKIDANEQKQLNIASKKDTSNQSSKKPNILKRKTAIESKKDENINKNIKKINLNKLNLDLRVQVPKLNLEQPVKINPDEEGIMYVTAKGTKPNERLLIKVKKVEKLSEKKIEKLNNKKKDPLALRPYLKFDKSEDSNIDEQIELYKKKRVQVLGEIANARDEVAEDPEIKTVDKNVKNEKLTEIKSEKEEVDEEEEKDSIKSPKDLQNLSRSEKLRQRLREIRNRNSDIDKDLSEDCTDRLKAILKQKDEYINEFMIYLKQRKIVASRLRDEDIIGLYEAKNNVVIDRLQIIFDNTDSNDPFEYRESYSCDYCFRVFPSRELQWEHEKIHEVKLMHFCEDCEQEFTTHKAKRVHNVTCVQKVLCRYCKDVLDSKGKKRQHEQKHCDEKYGQLCDRCGEKFKHQGTLDQHYKCKHMQLEKIFKCPQCPKRFAFRTKLTFHLKSVHTTSRAYLCEDCGSDFKNPASLRHHRIRKHQKINNKKECQVCHKMIPVYSMSKHMHTHKSYTIKCQHCDKKFKNTSTLKQHLRIHEDQRQYKCDHCGVGFNRRDGLRLHLKVHEKGDGKGPKECSCQVCGQKFPNHSTLVIHRNREHKDGRKHTCHICNRSMISTRTLEWHLAHIHNESLPGALKDGSSIDAVTKRVACVHCDKTFKTEMILRTHVKNTHIEKEPIKCSECDEQYTSEVRLKHHMMVQHGKTEGTFACPHCTKRFVNQLRLKTHMIAHSEERPYSCDICGFMLKTRIQLVKHKQNRHSDERPLQCKYCPHTCKQVSALVCHERTHTNERPYACSVCQQRFKYLGDKNKHERRHEVLGGSGFKRIVTGRDTNKRKKAKQSSKLTSEQEPDYGLEDAGEDYGEDAEIDDIENFEETEIVKLENEGLAADAGAAFETVYIGNATINASSGDLVSLNNAAVYSEEIATNQVEPQIITHDMIDESVLQPGTVIQLEQRDETGKIIIMPYLLSDLSEASSEVTLTPASILYDN